MRATLLTPIAAATITFTIGACGTDTDSRAAAPATVVETIGDTTVVRTLSGSVWGAKATLVPEVTIGRLERAEEYLFGSIRSIAVDDDWNVYVFDEQAQHVRVFDSAGVYVETLGGSGEGPGEFGRAESIALLSDGRLVVRDPGNMRVQVFGPGPGEQDEWRYDAGNTGAMSPLHTDDLNRTFLLARDLSQTGLVMHLIVLGPDGTPLDTVPQPSSGYEQATLRAEYTSRGGTRWSTANVPFAPSFKWTVHPNGHFLTGISSAYRIHLPRAGGVLRIERTSDPVPVSDAERDRQRERITRRMRNTEPNWSWNGPPIPDNKPFFKALLAGKDGRIWVMLSTEGEPVENENHDPDNPFSAPVTWREAIVYDVFESDGTYLGVVAPPEGFDDLPLPIFDGDHVWAVTSDELGVQRVVRYRIVVAGG